jgi:hypothetical protein
MAISYPTALTIRGPWLLDQAALEVLDEIFSDQRPALHEHAKAELESFARRRAQEDARPDTKPEELESGVRWFVEHYRGSYDVSWSNAVLFLRGGRTVKAPTLGEAIKHPVGTDETAVSMTYSLKVGKVEAEIALPGRYGFQPALQINVSPQDDSSAQELFGALRNWALEYGPPPWQQKWLKFQPGFGTAAFFWLFIFLIFWMGASTELYKGDFRHQAHTLLDKGLKPTDQVEALRLILALSSDYDPARKLFYRPGPQFYGWLILGFVVLTSMSFCPDTVIGIWAGKRTLERWKRWIIILWITIPGYLLTAILLPKLLRLVGISSP